MCLSRVFFMSWPISISIIFKQKCGKTNEAHLTRCCIALVFCQAVEDFSSLLWFPVATSLNESATSLLAVVIDAAALQLYPVSVATLNYTAVPSTLHITDIQFPNEFLSCFKTVYSNLWETFLSNVCFMSVYLFFYFFYNIKVIKQSWVQYRFSVLPGDSQDKLFFVKGFFSLVGQKTWFIIAGLGRSPLL